MADDLLVARGLVVAYGRPAAMFARRSVAPAVLSGIDIHVGKGETVGIVGESGSGKTTLGRALLGLVKPVAGSVIFDGRDITALDEKARRPLRRCREDDSSPLLKALAEAKTVQNCSL